METAEWGWGDGPTANPNDLPLQSVTKDPQGRLWIINGGGLSGGNRWVQVTGEGAIWDDNIALPANLKVDTPWYVADQPRIAANSKSTIKVGPLNEEKPTEDRTLRWPLDAINTDTDYVFFQFGKYIPPFSRDVNELREDGKIESLEKEGKTKQIRNYLRENSTTSATYEMYRNSEALDVSGRTDVMLPIPQDLSNEIQAQWLMLYE